MANSRSLLFTCDVKASPAEAYRAFVHETALRDWLCDVVRASPRAGGHLFLGWEDGYASAGQYERLDPGRSLAFSWKGADEPAATHVEVTFGPSGESTRVTLVHSGMGEGGAWDVALQGFQENWSTALEGLQSFLETGIDLRIVRRPRLGILYDQFTPQVAQKLGIPVNEGVLIMGTAEGSGAQAAGLQQNDVMVSLNGKALVDASSFGKALEGLHAGDRPLVEFYRGAEKHSVPLELSRFPIPEVPANAGELAAKVGELKSGVHSAMRELTQDLSEERAGRRPAEEEWSVKELVAHFILCERDYQAWVAEMLNDTPGKDDFEMRPNVSERIAAALARFDTLGALLRELALAQAESVAMIARFPEPFLTRRKHLYRRAALWAIENTTFHFYEEHLEQFKQAVAK